jgi:hypothetical protein
MLTEELATTKKIPGSGTPPAPHGPVKPGTNRKRCIYMSDEECILPATPFILCKACPYGYIHCFGAVVKNVYKKIIGISVLFRSIEDRRR